MWIYFFSQRLQSPRMLSLKSVVYILACFASTLVFLFAIVQQGITEVMGNPNEDIKSDSRAEPKILFDFTESNADVSKWTEQSDVVREPGMSKATLVLQKSRLFQRAVFFTLLNPQPNGAGFAGMRIPVQLNLSNYTAIQVRLRGQGSNSHYKVNLRHKHLDDEPHPTYEQMFEVSMNQGFEEVTLPLKDFWPYYRGRKMDPNEVGYLDTANITNFEFQMYGGVYLPYKQSGPSSLEIDWVKAV